MATQVETLEPLPAPEPPPAPRLPPGRWVMENLLTPWYNALLTAVAGPVLGWALYRALRFVFVTARWEIIRRNLTNFVVLFYPREQLWRPWAAAFLLTLVLAVRFGARRPMVGRGEEERLGRRDVAGRLWPLAVFGVVVGVLSGSRVTAALLAGLGATAIGSFWIARRFVRLRVRWLNLLALAGLVAAFEILVGFGGRGVERWGGLMLTIFLAVAGIALSFPIGVLLALGRRSTLPAVRAVSVAYIELIRGVPLVTLLFMGFFVVGFFLPPGVRAPSVAIRALIAFVMFTSAYVAEIVRGGLQAVPRGQVEAALAVGLSPLKTTRLVVLPQALRVVIPALVGQFISLFKDTSLVAVLGLVEWLGVAQQVTSQPSFVGQGLQPETLVFASFGYWVGAYWMSKESRRLERRLGLGER